MDKKKQRWIELGKDVLILLLSCSTIYLATSILVPGGLRSLWQDADDARASVVQQQEASVVAWPVRIAVSSGSGESVMRYGVQYDREACEAQFAPVASLLREALSSPGAARTAAEREWHVALSETSSIYFDLLGEVPLSVLSGWLAGTDSGLEGTVRRLVLAAEGDVVTLFYRDEDTGIYYARRAELVTSEQVAAVVENVVDNGAKFAFETGEYSSLAGDTMLLPEPPQPRVYSVTNPLAGEGQVEEVRQDSVLGQLLLALSFPDSSYIYSGTDQVIRSGNDTLRISSDGTVRYASAEGDVSRYPVPAQGEQPTKFEMAEACRRLVDSAVGSLSGAARLYLRGIYQIGDSWQLDFGYCLDGAAVQVGELGYAAHFQVEGGEITQFTLHLRSYADTGTRSIVLPERQAMAAMEALEVQGSELMLTYRAMGGETVSAGWVAD
ncbi:MAG: hypothetical protein IJZ66_05005 [Oscillibacter sp.]|nr:hypothetical protein [Oscillibacter sp.]